MSPRPDVSAQRVPQILDAALTVFARRGIEAASVEDIAREAGVSKGLVFKYFASRDDLIVSFVRHFFAMMMERLEYLGATEAGFGETLGIWCAELAGMLEAEGQAAVGTQLMAGATREGMLKDAVQEAYRRYREIIARWAEVAMKRGEIAHGDARAVARGITGVIEGVTLMWLIFPEGRLIDRYGEVMEPYLAGLAPR